MFPFTELSQINEINLILGRVRYFYDDYPGTAYFKFLCDALKNKSNKDFVSAITAANMKFKEVVDEDYEDDHEFYRETPIYFSTLRKLIPIRRNLK